MEEPLAFKLLVFGVGADLLLEFECTTGFTFVLLFGLSFFTLSSDLETRVSVTTPTVLI